MVQQRLAELQAEAAKNSEITVESLMRELEDARLKATSLNQLAAAVRATGEKIKLSGLITQKIEVKQNNNDPFTDDMSSAEILAIVAREKGEKAAWHLAMSFGEDPKDHGIALEGTVIWGKGQVIEGAQVIGGKESSLGRKDPEMRHASAVAKTFRPAVSRYGVSQRLLEEAKPAKRKIG